VCCSCNVGLLRHRVFHIQASCSHKTAVTLLQGTCQRLEKSYFRLTSAPDPAEVRPEGVLAAALDRLLRLVRAGQEKYLYLLDQFKVCETAPGVLPCPMETRHST
jgi:hypothetical protein